MRDILTLILLLPLNYNPVSHNSKHFQSGTEKATMRFTWTYQVLITLFVPIVLMDAARTTPEDHAMKLHDGRRLQKMLRLFPQCSYRARKHSVNL
jgi:hypothetical protein